MTLTSTGLLETAAPQPLPLAQSEAGSDARTAATDFLQIESIVLNLDASLRVHAKAHFFSWTQGLLQSLIRHELLICTLCHGKPPAFRADGFSMSTPDPAMLSDMFLRDTSVAPALLTTCGALRSRDGDFRGARAGGAAAGDRVERDPARLRAPDGARQAGDRGRRARREDARRAGRRGGLRPRIGPTREEIARG